MHISIDSFVYPDSAEPALSGIDFAVRPGECVLVAGGSGSGKTTLGLILAGVLPGQHRGQMKGSIDLGGESLEFPQTQAFRVDHQRWSARVGYAGQDPAAQLSTIAPTVAEEIAFPLENAGVPRQQMRDRVRQTAIALGLADLLESDPAELSGGQQKLVAIASAVARGPGCLVLDEPLAGLDFDARTAVRTALKALLADGMGIVLLSQDFAGAGLAPQTVVLLDQGQAVFAGTMDQAAQQAVAFELPILHLPSSGTAAESRDSSAMTREPAPSGKTPRRMATVPVFTATALRFAYGWRSPRPPRPWRRNTMAAEPVLNGVDLAVRAGECLAVTGANGSGKSTLLRLLTGLSVPQTGQMDWHAGGSRHAGKGSETGPGPDTAVLGALLQHPREQLFERSVRREVGAGLHPGLDKAVRQELVDAALRRCGLLDVSELHPYELPASGQRLTALAALLVRSPGFIALDEPTVSLDGRGLELLASVMATEAERGAAVVMVTHDLDFAHRTCSRLMVLSEGKVVAEGPFTEVLESHFRSGVAYGVAAPATWRR